MLKQSLKKVSLISLSILLFSASFVTAQEPTLKISKPENIEKAHDRSVVTTQLERESVFRRLQKDLAASSLTKKGPRGGIDFSAVAEKSFQVASTPTLHSFGTGGGDVYELEPNDFTAQSVSLPVNVFGRIGLSGDDDFFAFQALAGQQIVVEAFATRLSNSSLIADIALFNSSGQLLRRNFGNDRDDPIIVYTPVQDEIFVVGITDVENLGGASFDYVLNLTRGVDVDEREPNDRTAQGLGSLPVTVFADITGRNDVDFYSFVAQAGQTLIVDVDAEVFGSRLDAEMNLSDPQTGLEYFYNDQFDGDDPRFNIVLPYTGRYVIGVGAFDSNSAGFYRLNVSLVPKTNAPLLMRATRLAKKLLEVEATGIVAGARVEVNGIARNTSVFGQGILRAKVKAKIGDVVTVVNASDGRRSNPLLVQ
jgi:hypothetical protein